MKHGDYRKRLYRIWKNMKYRCLNPNSAYYKSYGGRGITVCPDWHIYEIFKSWALSNGYDEGLTLDRIDNDAGYCPSNCRWTNMKKQSNNRRSNRTIEYNGLSYTLSEWAVIKGINVATLWDRLDSGWSVERALTEPTHNNGVKKTPQLRS